MDEINKKVKVFYCVVPENIHTPPTEGIGNSREEGGVSKTQKFKGMYKAKLEFPEGWGGSEGKSLPWGGGGGGMDIFWNQTLQRIWRGLPPIIMNISPLPHC